MDDVRKPQLKFKDNNMLLRFSFACSLKVMVSGGDIEEVKDADFD